MRKPFSPLSSFLPWMLLSEDMGRRSCSCPAPRCCVVITQSSPLSRKSQHPEMPSRLQPYPTKPAHSHWLADTGVQVLSPLPQGGTCSVMLFTLQSSLWDQAETKLQAKPHLCLPFPLRNPASLLHCSFLLRAHLSKAHAPHSPSQPPASREANLRQQVLKLGSHTHDQGMASWRKETQPAKEGGSERCKGPAWVHKDIVKLLNSPRDTYLQMINAFLI